MSDEHRRRFIESQGADPDVVDHQHRRERALAVLDEWVDTVGEAARLLPKYQASHDFDLRVVAALRILMNQHIPFGTGTDVPPEFRGTCSCGNDLPCDDRGYLAVLDALVPEEVT